MRPPQCLPLVPLLHLLLLVSAAAAQSPGYAPGSQPELAPGGAPAQEGPPAPVSHAAPPYPPPTSAPAPYDQPQVPVSSPDSPPQEGPSSYFQPPGPGPTPENPYARPPLYGGTDVAWCAVREEFEDCLKYTSLLNTPDLSWTCVLGENKVGCMEQIKNGDAHLMSLEAGLAYIAFLNHSMKAILAEEYNFHAQSYAAVAVVNKHMCDVNPNLQLEDFRNLRSCHPGYLTAAGWNYPVSTLLDSPLDPKVLNESMTNDMKVITSFFSSSCAPSELGEGGICSACGNGGKSSFCSSDSNEYTGEDGAFRCLMDGSGDIAFLRAKTPTLYSSDGLNNQPWSSKSVDEFMYLCPSGGCKPVNDNYGSCQFATIPANVVMTRNSLPESLKQVIIQTLLAANWMDALYTGRNWPNYLLSVSTQGLSPVKQVTKQYLGTSAVVSQTILDLRSDKIHLSTAVMSRVPAYPLTLALGALTICLLSTLVDFL